MGKYNQPTSLLFKRLTCDLPQILKSVGIDDDYLINNPDPVYKYLSKVIAAMLSAGNC